MTNLFGHSVRWEPLFLCLTEALTWFCAFWAILAWGSMAGSPYASTLAAAMALSGALISGAVGLYHPAVWLGVRRLLARTAIAAAILLALWSVLLGVLPLLGVSPGALDLDGIEVLAGFAATVVITRLGVGAASRRGLLRHRIILLRPAAGAAPQRGEPKGHLPRTQPARTQAPKTQAPLAAAGHAIHVVASLDTADDLAAALDPTSLRARRVQAIVASDPGLVPAELRARCDRHGVPVLDEREFRERHQLRVDVDSLPPDWLRQTRAAQAGPAAHALHRLFDLAAGTALLLVTLPVLLLTAIAIKLDSAGPVFYRQERVGRGGRPFLVIKFRSMRVDAEAAGRPVWASRHDPRVTRVGRFIRRVRIDEIPQVFNVLRGEMAFVGPRPERPAFVEQLRRAIPHYDDRAIVKPGITGWAQVNYPYGASVEDARMKLSYDLYYIRRRSLFLDLLIVLATVRVVLFQEGSR
jgi:sugar transferase (PEP-CTERM system associated)